MRKALCHVGGGRRAAPVQTPSAGGEAAPGALWGEARDARGSTAKAGRRGGLRWGGAGGCGARAMPPPRRLCRHGRGGGGVAITPWPSPGTGRAAAEPGAAGSSRGRLYKAPPEGRRVLPPPSPAPVQQPGREQLSLL